MSQITQNETQKLKKIVFPFVEAGLGHIMPMRAVCDAFKAKYGDKCEVVETYFFQDKNDPNLKYVEDVLIEEVHKHNRNKIHGFYQFLLMRLGGPQLTVNFLYRVLWKRGLNPSLDYIKELNPDLIFNTHFATLFYACHAKKKRLINSKIAMYCPDPVVGKQWDRRAELITISSPVGKQRGERALSFRLRGTRFAEVPFLIRKEIATYTKTRQEYKEELGLPIDKFTILLADGAYGAGKLKDTVYELLKTEIPITIISVCGKNQKLYEEFLALTPPAHITFKPFGFTDKMLLLSAACDLFIGKAGASNLAEPTYFGAPSIVTFTATPIEKWICRHYTHFIKSAVKITNIKKAVELALSWAQNPELMKPYIENSKTGRRHDGPDKLADLLWEELND